MYVIVCPYTDKTCYKLLGKIQMLCQIIDRESRLIIRLSKQRASQSYSIKLPVSRKKTLLYLCYMCKLHILKIKHRKKNCVLIFTNALRRLIFGCCLIVVCLHLFQKLSSVQPEN